MAISTAQDVGEIAFDAALEFDPAGSEALPLTAQHLLGEDRPWGDQERAEITKFLVRLETSELTHEEVPFASALQPGANTKYMGWLWQLLGREDEGLRLKIEELLRDAPDPELRKSDSVNGEGQAYRLYDCTHLPGASVFCCRINIHDVGWIRGFVIAPTDHSFNS